MNYVWSSTARKEELAHEKKPDQKWGALERESPHANGTQHTGTNGCDLHYSNALLTNCMLSSMSLPLAPAFSVYWRTAANAARTKQCIDVETALEAAASVTVESAFGAAVPEASAPDEESEDP